VLRQCESMVVVIGPRWATVEGKHGGRRLFDSRDWVRHEVETALRRRDVQVLPVLVAGAEMPAPEDLPESLRTLPDLNAIDLSDNLRRRRDDVRHLITTLAGGTDPPNGPWPARPLLEALVTAAAAGVAGGALGGVIAKPGPDNVERILANATQRALTWAVVGGAIAVWLTILRGERRGGVGRGLFGLMVGALAGALGGAVFGAAVNLPDQPVGADAREQIQIGAMALIGCGIGALLGRLWIPPRAGPGLVAGAAGGAFAQILLNAGDWDFPSALAVSFRSLMIVGFATTTMLVLDALHSTSTARTGVRPAV
jgi:hypothetical protein